MTHKSGGLTKIGVDATHMINYMVPIPGYQTTPLERVVKEKTTHG